MLGIVNNYNMIKTKISVIVAAYNVEQYLHKCIDSILAQTFTNLEVILVDDGSPDNSGSICDEYAQKDSRVKVIHKQNGGQSTARNAALDVATGDYIGFIDGDDWIEPEMYEQLLKILQSEQADIVQCGWFKVESNGDKILTSNAYKEIYVDNQGLDELISSQGGHLNTSVCCKLFDANLARKYRFSPVRAYEDDEYIFKTVSDAKKVVCIHTPYYDYLNREGSTMTSHFNINKIALITIQKNICDLLKYRYPERFDEMQKVLCSKQFYILNCLLNANDIPSASVEARKIKDSIMSSYDEYMSNSQMGKNKLMLWLMMYTPPFIWKIILKVKFS